MQGPTREPTPSKRARRPPPAGGQTPRRGQEMQWSTACTYVTCPNTSLHCVTPVMPTLPGPTGLQDSLGRCRDTEIIIKTIKKSVIHRNPSASGEERDAPAGMCCPAGLLEGVPGSPASPSPAFAASEPLCTVWLCSVFLLGCPKPIVRSPRQSVLWALWDRGCASVGRGSPTEVPASQGAVTSRGICRKPEGSPAACCHETEPKWKPRIPSPSRTLGPAAFASHPAIFYHRNQRKTKPSFFFFFSNLSSKSGDRSQGTRDKTFSYVDL